MMLPADIASAVVDAGVYREITQAALDQLAALVVQLDRANVIVRSQREELRRLRTDLERFTRQQIGGAP